MGFNSADPYPFTIYAMRPTTTSYCLLLAALLTFSIGDTQAQSYNALWIPDTLSVTNFNLTIKDTFAQLTPGNQTITARGRPLGLETGGRKRNQIHWLLDHF